jgi:hypothetical protein
MNEFLSILKQVGTAFLAFIAYSMGAKDKMVQQELAEKDAAIKAATKVLGANKKYEKLKNIAPDSWDSIKRLSDDTKNKVSSSAKTKLP